MSDTESGFEYDSTLEGLCERVTYILGDAEKGYPNQTWEKDFLRAIACDAVLMLATVKPDLFKAEEIEIPVEPETGKQTVDCEICEKVLEFVCFLDADGNVIPAVDGKYDLIQRAALLGGSCYDCDDPNAAGISSIQVGVSEVSVNSFAITPMVPAGEKVTALVRCLNIKQYTTGESSFPEGVRAHFTTLIQLMLYLALSGDKVAGGNAELANAHFNNFVASVNLGFQQAQFLRQQLEDAR